MKLILIILMLLPTIGHNTESYYDPMDYSKLDFLITNAGKIDIDHLNLVYDCSVIKGLDPLLVMRLVKVESGYNPYAKSHANAVGYFLIRPIAQKCVNMKTKRNFNRHKIEDNIRIGTSFLYIILKRFDGDMEQALRYYNGGNKALKIKSTKIYAKKIMGV